jgi:hypothetical protein
VSTPLVWTVIVLAAVGAVFCAVKLWQACRTVDDAIGRDRTHDVPPPPPAAPDNVPGTDVFALDDCLRILHATNQLDAGYARLWDAITEHRKENDS